MSAVLACPHCDEQNHYACENRTIYEPATSGEEDLIEAIYGGPVTACCCDPRDGFIAVNE